MRRLQSEPLSLRDVAIVAIVLFVGGTIYCQLYCLIAYQRMDGMVMPLALSMYRSAAETIPALAAFELSKRVLDDPSTARRFARVVAMLALVAVLTVASLRMISVLSYGTSMPVRLILADRLPGLTVAALAIVWANRQTGTSAPSSGELNFQREELLPPGDVIDWVRAAGNYIEIHFGGRTTMLRMTLRRAASLLEAEEFVQVHRSVLVNRQRIRELNHQDRRFVELQDGTLVRVGQFYRARLFDE